MIAHEVEGPLWSVPVLGPKPLLSHCGPSWAALRAYAGGLGPLSGLCGRSWAALGVYVGSLGSLLGPMLVVLHGPLLEPMLTVLRRLGAEVVGLGPKWSVLEGEQGRKVAQTRAGRPFWGGDRF